MNNDPTRRHLALIPLFSAHATLTLYDERGAISLESGEQLTFTVVGASLALIGNAYAMALKSGMEVRMHEHK